MLTGNFIIRLGVACCKYTYYSLQRVAKKLSYSLVCESTHWFARKMMEGREKCLSFSNIILGTDFFRKSGILSNRKIES